MTPSSGSQVVIKYSTLCPLQRLQRLVECLQCAHEALNSYTSGSLLLKCILAADMFHAGVQAWHTSLAKLLSNVSWVSCVRANLLASIARLPCVTAQTLELSSSPDQDGKAGRLFLQATVPLPAASCPTWAPSTRSSGTY